MAITRYLPLLGLVLCVLSACATPPVHLTPENSLAYNVSGEGRLADNAPLFVVENPAHDYNRIGSPIIEDVGDGSRIVSINPDTPQIFAEERSWAGQRGRYTNLVYRVHFSEIPSSILPFYLTAGKNVGLLVIVTLDERNQPVLVTSLHTCGCYLAIIPTSFLDPAALPEGWNSKEQYVYGETLPGILTYDGDPTLAKLHIWLRDGVHRVMAIRLEDAAGGIRYPQVTVTLHPKESLVRLPFADGETFSFFETDGPRKDYVHGSQKIWERLLISWWAFDWRVGEDKRLGRNTDDGPVFYTSLKPWARAASDLRDFPAFLKYWGWSL
ncbi:hypothetical protein [Desulfopila aestuarii]|uniref:Uncharacterized protein n=1 Tax=Desulfopila aestuarii DSM 18488 TaxID=1121416 RepID=A0A1M7Y523_9BACT|nr:hypothetical protein [Desulfopila aestuarii]SHO47290.1 hypothetical protein SAMN02745220_01814 [Desulfopila aestuarii DSM 18488]